MPKRNPDSLDSQLERLRREATESGHIIESNKTKIVSLKVQLVALEKRKEDKLAEIEKAATDRQSRLEADLLLLENQLTSTGSAVSHTQKVLDNLVQKKVLLEAEVEALEAQVNEAAVMLERRMNMAQSKVDQMNKTSADLATLRDDRKTLEDLIVSLKGDLPVLQQQIDDLKSQREGLAMEAARELEAHTAKVMGYEAEAKKLRDDLTRSRLSYQAEQRQQELERAQLAVRIIAADERDTVLKLRERKIKQGEQYIQANASLLDL